MLVMVSYGLRLSFWIGMAVYLIVQLGTLIPNAPANVGAYQFFCVVGLRLFVECRYRKSNTEQYYSSEI
jgi:hypothetical protein